VDICLLWHVRHANDEAGRARHQGTLDGDWFADEQAGDDVKLLGAYSSEAKANERMREARALPGFDAEPQCFFADRYELDHDEWTTGYMPA